MLDFGVTTPSFLIRGVNDLIISQQQKFKPMKATATLVYF